MQRLHRVVDGLGAMRPDATVALHKDLDSSFALIW